MSLTTLTTTDLKQITKLLSRKEALAAELLKINSELAAYEGGAPAPKAAKAAKAAKAPAPGRGRRDLKGAIVDLLKKSGKDGVTVKDIATKVKVSPNRIYTWFYGTGKKLKEIKKVGSAKYRWEA